MSKRINYTPWLQAHADGPIYWTLDDAHKLVAGWKPIEDDDKQLTPKLTATSNRAMVGQRNLIADFHNGNTPCPVIQDEADPELEAIAGVKHRPTPFVDADCYIRWAKSKGYVLPAALHLAIYAKRKEIEDSKKKPLDRKELADKRFGYSDFILDWQVEKPAHWYGFEVRPDGVYVAVPADDDPLVTAKERADSTWHHEADLTKPALRFPYSLKELHAFVSAYKLESLIASNEIYGLMGAMSDISQSHVKAIERENGLECAAQSDEPVEFQEGAVDQVGRQTLREQEKAILGKLVELGYNPKALPPYESGKPGVRAEIRKTLSSSPLFEGKTTFKKAWERISVEDIAYAKARNPPPPK